jgi:hypothetical protein
VYVLHVHAQSGIRVVKFLAHHIEQPLNRQLDLRNNPFRIVFSFN